MSSPEGDEGSIWGAGPDPEGGQQARKQGPTLGASPSSPGQSGLPQPASLEEEREVTGAGGPVLWGREGRPGSPANVEGRLLGYLGSEAATAILQQLINRDDLGVRRNPSPESCDSKVSTVWADPQPGPGGTGAPGPGVAGWRLPSAAPARRRGSGGGRAWGNPRRGAKSRGQVPVERQPRPAEGLGGSPSDSESSDEFSEEQLLSLSMCRRGGGQAKRHGPQDAPRHSCTHLGEKFLPVQGSFLPSAPRPLASVGEKQAAGGLDVSWKKPQSGVCGKAGSRPSYLPGAVAAAAGGLPKVTPGRKVAQEKKSPGGACKAAPRNTFPSWEHTASEAAPLESATFPPLSGSPLLGRGRRYPLGPLGTKYSKRSGTGQKCVARRKRGSLPVVVEDKEPRRDPDPEVQVSMRLCSPWLSTLPCPALPCPAPSVPFSGFVTGHPASQGCQSWAVLARADPKMTLPVCWASFSTTGKFPGPPPADWPAAVEGRAGAADLGAGTPSKSGPQSFSVQDHGLPDSYLLATPQAVLAGALGFPGAPLFPLAQLASCPGAD